LHLLRGQMRFYRLTGKFEFVQCCTGAYWRKCGALIGKVPISAAIWRIAKLGTDQMQTPQQDFNLW
jgi:hypothetical protein